MRRALIDAPRWLLLGVLVYAPWAYGCTRPWTIHLLDAFLGLLLVLWLLGLGVRRALPVVHPLLAFAVMAALILGWGMTLNAHSLYDPEFHQFVPISSFWENGPGSVNREVSLDMMWRVTGLLGTLCFVADLSSRKQWRHRIWWTLVLTGASLSAFGLFQKFMGAPMIFWESGRAGSTFFATFYYHGNAGAFINLVLPLAAGLLLSVVSQESAYREKALTASALFLIVISAFVNVSKAGMVIAILLLLTLGLWYLVRFLVMQDRTISFTRLTGSLIGALIVIAVVASLAWEMTAKRWEEMPKLMTADNPRILMVQSCLRMLPAAGAFGIGPGTFETVFPHLNDRTGPTGIWRYAHEDYLQTLIEWGWAGAASLATIFAGGVISCFRGSHRGRNRTLLLTSAIALFGIALHALIDFPLQIASLQLYTVTLLGFGWGSNAWEKSR